MKIGTSHFTTIAAAQTYYRKQGISLDATLQKIMDGEISIGAPNTKKGDTLQVIEGRFHIVEAAPVKVQPINFTFDTNDYYFTHGKKPRGAGSWAFFPTRAMRIDDAVWSPVRLTFTEAKKWFNETQQSNAAFRSGIAYLGT